MKNRDMRKFWTRYIAHLWRCYQTVSEVIKHRDKMFDKVYHL